MEKLSKQIRNAIQKYSPEMQGRIVIAFRNKRFNGIEPPEDLALFFDALDIQRVQNWREGISKTMKGNSNAVKTFEKVSKQKKQNKTEKTELSEKTEKKIKFLDFVYLTQEEHDRLIKNYGPAITNSMIQRLNDYIGQIGESKAKAKYKSHYFTIMNRTRRDGGDKVNVAREQALQEHRKKIQQEILDSNQSQNGESIQESGFDRRAEIGC